MAYLKGVEVSGSNTIITASVAIFTNVTGSTFSGSFIGDGSQLTGIVAANGVTTNTTQSIPGPKSFTRIKSSTETQV